MRLAERLRALLRRALPKKFTFVCPPPDWRDVEGWNTYWTKRLEEARQDLVRIFDIRTIECVMVPRELPRFISLGYRRLLIVGNGISIMPRVFHHAGFETAALDVSSVATKFAGEYTPTEQDWKIAFQIDEHGEVGEQYARFAREGGSLDFVCGDMFDPAVTPGPFDIIWSSRSIQGFAEIEMTQAIRALDARLQPDGECHVLVQNSGEKCEEITAVFKTLGYSINPVAEEPGKKLFIGIGSG